MTSFADDGYVLRSIGDEVIAVGKTDAGLDRAVRAYAKAVEAGQSTDFDTVYNEGPRVKKLTIAGRDISEYVIRTTEENDSNRALAASELQTYLGKATGFYPEIVTEDREHMIVLEKIPEDDPRYESLKGDGFIFSVRENGDLYISSRLYRGCLYGVYEFLEKYIGWRFLYDQYNVSSYSPNYDDGNIDFLYEAEHIDIPADLNETQNPALVSRSVSRSRYKTQKDRRKHNYGEADVPRLSNHGLMNIPCDDLVDSNGTYSAQICFTNKINIEVACEFYVNQCLTRIEAGQVVGKDFVDVDAGQYDNANFCKCKECMKLFKSEGCFTGPMLYFSNLIADAVAEVDPQIYVNVLVYSGTTALPKNIRPRDNISASYCFYGDSINKVQGCYSHSISGEDCADENVYFVTDGATVSNKRFGPELRAWNEVYDRITIWYYPGIWNCTAMSSPFLHRVYEDMMFLLECENVVGIHLCTSGSIHELGYNRPEEMPCEFVVPEITWHGQMTYEEYLAFIREYYYIMCGDGADELMEYYFDVQLRCSPTKCWNTFTFTKPTDRIIFSEVRNNFDHMVSLFRTARALAQTERQESYVEQLSQTMYFTGLVASHTEWYLEGDETSRAKYVEYFEELKQNTLENGFHMYTYLEPFSSLKEEDFDIEQNLGRLVINEVTAFSLTEDWYLYE